MTDRQSDPPGDNGSMTPARCLAIALCWMVNALDGFDVLAMAFAAPVLSAQWALPRSDLGTVLSAGIAGMVAGGMLLGPLADRYGRRWLVVGGLVLTALAMLGTATAMDTGQLLAWRFLTGLGIGCQLAAVTALVTEHAPPARRKRILGLFHTGYPIGATLAGVLAAGVIEQHGWQAVFIAGGLATLGLVPLVLAGLPESEAFLATGPARGALDRVNRLRGRFGTAPLAALPEAPESTRPGPVTLLATPWRATTVLLWSAFFCAMLVVYFLQSWTPQLVADAMAEPGMGVRAGIAMNLGGIAGIVLLGLLSDRRSLRSIAVALLLAGAAMMAGFTRLPGIPPLVLAYCFGMGLLVFGGYIGVYFAAGLVYPPGLRATGIGWAVGIGRAGAVLGPWLAGFIAGLGLAAGNIYPVFALPLLLCALAFSRVSSAAVTGVDRRR